MADRNAPVSIAERLMRGTRQTPSGCILRERFLNNGGYSRIRLNGRCLMAHRIAWELVHGPIPGDLTVDHMCKQTTCINVDHLRLLTNAENSLDGGGWRQSAERRRNATHCQRGHEFTAENTYVHVWHGKTRRSCRSCQQLRYRARI